MKTNNGHNLFTRKEIIKLWENQKEEFLNKLCCPYCRDILTKQKDGTLFCNNPMCKNFTLYSIKEKKK